MKLKSVSTYLPLVISAIASANAAIVTRSSTTDNLNLAGAWTSTAPGAGDVATWDAASSQVNTMGANLSWGGLNTSAASGPVTIGGSHTLTLGSSGLNIGDSANLTYNSSGTIALNGPLAGSTTLTLNHNATKTWSGMASTSFTGTLVLRGGTGSSGAFSGNWLAFGGATFSQTGSFALDTGASLTNRGEFIVTDAWGDGTAKPKMSLSSLSGFGDFRSDWGGTGNRTISVASASDSEFQGRIVQNNNATRSIHLEKLGTGRLTLSGDNSYQNTIVGAGKLRIGNGGSTGNIGLGTVSVASGATLEFDRSNLIDYKTIGRMRNVSGSGDIVLTGGAKLFNYPGTGLGFTEAGSWNNFSGKLTIKGGAEFQTIRNGATAMGTAQVVLGDETSSGKLSQIEGNWTWTNNIQLLGSANEIMNNSIGSDRFNKIQGVLSGSGNVKFSDPTGAMTNGDRGFILTGTNTMSGTVTVDTFVRVGGVSGSDPALTGGDSGSLGAAAVVINSGKRLTFTRTGSHTVANSISGEGSLHIGTTGLTETNSQQVELSGASTYTGATSVNRGRLHLTGSLASNVNVASGAKFSGDGETSGLLTMASGSGLVLAGGALTTSVNLGDGAHFEGPCVASFDAEPIPNTVYDVFTYGEGLVTGIESLNVAWRGSLADDTVNKKITFTAGSAGNRTWNTNSGNWEQGVDENFAEGDLLFYGGDSVFFNNPVEESTVTLWGPLVPASITVNNTNGYTFSGTGTLTGAMTLTKTGAGVLTLATANTYTGGTILQEGQLNINHASALGATASVFTIAGTSTLDNTSGAAITLTSNNPHIWNADFTFTGSNNLDLGTGVVTLGGNRQITVGDRTLTVGGVIGGSYGITKSGAGTLSLGGANTYLGATTISGGRLRVTSGANILTPEISIASGAVFEWSPTLNNVTFAGSLSGSGKVLRTDSAANNAVFSGDNSSFNGSWEITGDYLGFTSDAGIGAPALGMTWNGGGIYFTATGNTLASTRTINLGESGGFLNGATGNTNTFAAKFTGPGSLNKVSGERAILTHPDNDFTGAITIIGGGTLELGGEGRIGNGLYSNTINIASANTFAYTSSADQFLTGVISGAGRLAKGGSGVLTLDAVNTYTGTTTIDGGTLVIGAGDSLYSTSAFFGTAATTNVFVNTGGTLETRNWQYGSGFAFNQMRNNSYAVRINGGTVRFTETTPAVRGFQIGANGATLEAVSGITYTKLAGTVLDDNLLVGVSGGSIVLTGSGDGEIQDPIGTHGTWNSAAGITKEGSGTWSLSGANTYLGDTRVVGGVLVVNGSSIADTNKLVLDGGKVQPNGTEVVNTLYFGGVQKAAGTWGSSSSTAQYKDDSRFTGTGVVNVISGPPSGYQSWISGFNLGGQTGIDQDPDNDGFDNGLEFILAGGNPEVPGGPVIPTGSKSGNNLIFSFQRDDRAKAADVTIAVEAGADLVTWPSVHLIGADTAASSSTVVISGDEDADPDIVTVTIPTAGAPGFFARIKVVGAP